MHAPVVWSVVVLLLALVGAVVVLAQRAEGFVVRALALEVLTMLLVAVLALAAAHHERAGYADVALVLALLGFVQTVAAARLVEQRWRRDE